MVQVIPIQKNLLIKIEGLDLSCTLNGDEFEIIKNIFEACGVIIFESQAINIIQQIAFLRRFGPLEPSIRRYRKRAISNVYMSDISNVGPDGAIMAEGSEVMSLIGENNYGIQTLRLKNNI